jgi:hypothetical protein
LVFLISVEDVADSGRDDVAESLDGVADHLPRHTAEVDLAEEPVDAKLGVQVEDLLGDLCGPPAIRAPRRAAMPAMASLST